MPSNYDPFARSASDFQPSVPSYTAHPAAPFGAAPQYGGFQQQGSFQRGFSDSGYRLPSVESMSLSQPQPQFQSQMSHQPMSAQTFVPSAATYHPEPPRDFTAAPKYTHAAPYNHAGQMSSFASASQHSGSAQSLPRLSMNEDYDWLAYAQGYSSGGPVSGFGSRQASHQ